MKLNTYASTVATADEDDSASSSSVSVPFLNDCRLMSGP